MPVFFNYFHRYLPKFLFRKLAGKRGRKNQMLQLEITELKDKLKVCFGIVCTNKGQ